MNVLLQRLMVITIIIAASNAIEQGGQMATPRSSEVYFAVAVVISAVVLAFT